MRYLSRLIQVVETKVKGALPNQLSLVFDGCLAGSKHYLGLFESFSSANEIGYETRLLGFSALGDETRLDAEESIS